MNGLGLLVGLADKVCTGVVVTVKGTKNKVSYALSVNE